MLKRTLFFWIDRLKINPAERLSVSVLIVLFVLLSLLNAVMQPDMPFRDGYYRNLKQDFRRRTVLLKKRRNRILARYRLSSAGTASDTVRRDSIPDRDSHLQEKHGSPAGKTTLKVNVNTANAEKLESLPGIGPTYARRIVKYRKENGSFETFEELRNIKGIGKKRLEKLLPFVKLKDEMNN